MFFRIFMITMMLLAVMIPIIKIPSYPDVFMCDKARDVCELTSKKFWQSNYHLKKSFLLSDVKSMDVHFVEKKDSYYVPTGKINAIKNAFHKKIHKKRSFYRLPILRLNLKNGYEYLFDFRGLNQKIAEDIIKTFNSFLTSTDQIIEIILESSPKE